MCLTAAALIFVPQANEKYYDLFGALGFLTSTAVSIYYPALKQRYLLGNTTATLPSLTPRQLLLNAAIGGWATRLGSFLFLVSSYPVQCPIYLTKACIYAESHEAWGRFTL